MTLSTHDHTSDEITSSAAGVVPTAAPTSSHRAPQPQHVATHQRPPSTLASYIPWILFGLCVAAAGVYFIKEKFFSRNSEAEHAEVKKVEFDNPPWNGEITVDTAARAAIGLEVAEVAAQSEPIRLPLLGTTTHDETQVTKIRPFFRGRVEKIYVDVGQTVKIGEPMADLYSSELARAKTDFAIEQSQWQYEKKLLETRTELAKTNAISGQILLETRNREMRERNELEISKEKLLVFGLSQQEIDEIDKQEGTERARLALRSPANGVVISRDVVSGNLYDETSVIFTIAPADHLWVWGNVFERDLNLVRIGQNWKIDFPFINESIVGNVEYISPNVDPGVHAIKIRTTIPNREGRLKSDMLVRGSLEIPPTSGNTTIPRSAMVVVDGSSYAFVQIPGKDDKFKRVPLKTAYEKDDRVVATSGLKAGDHVVVMATLMLEQLYEEGETLATGRVSGFKSRD